MRYTLGDQIGVLAGRSTPKAALLMPGTQLLSGHPGPALTGRASLEGDPYFGY